MCKRPHISEKLLRTCLQKQYHLRPVTLEFLPVGHDYDAGVYHVVSMQGRVYVLKATSRLLYAPSCLVPAYLRDQGITSIVAPVPTRRGALWTQLGEWVVILYPWINGESSLTGMTNVQWKEVGNIFRRIHQVKLPAFGFESLRKEHFDPTEYAQWIHTFETHSRLVLLGTVMSITLVLTDIPTGVWADALGRKRPLVIGHLLLAASMVMTGLVTAFPLLVVTQVLWGLGWAFLIGADVAWITDELAQPQRIARVLTAGTRWGLVGGVTGMVVFGVLDWATRLSTAMVVSGVGIALLGLFAA